MVISWLTEIFARHTVLNSEFSQDNTTFTRRCTNASLLNQIQQYVIFLHKISFTFTQSKIKVTFSFNSTNILFAYPTSKRRCFDVLKAMCQPVMKVYKYINFKFVFFLKFANWNFRMCYEVCRSFYFLNISSIINVDTRLSQLCNFTCFWRTSLWVKNSCILLLKVSSWSIKSYGRIFDIVATSKMQYANLWSNKNSFGIFSLCYTFNG